MKQLNNKGITTVEVVVCFALMIIIVVSMYTSVSSYKNKQSIESFRQDIVTYKNLLTKEIQDDLIMGGLASASISDTQSINNTITVDVLLKNGTKKQLKILKMYGDNQPYSSDKKDVISYGTIGNLIDYPIPNLGLGNYNGIIEPDLKINNININTDNNILTIYIGFYHPDFSTRYAIDIVCPINYY